jgi:uncharacterized protein (DUF488 family)
MVTIWTVGHSTRSSNEFTQLLLDHHIEALVDVRSFPGSRRYPHFNRTLLAEQLHSNDVEYFHLPSLGGRRKPRADSQNTAWQNASFRAYADHMESEEFEQGIEELLRIGSLKRTAIMCAEAVWWSCHRSLISDYLKSNEVEVLHIVNLNRVEPHPYTTAARIVDGKLSYRGLLPEL